MFQEVTISQLISNFASCLAYGIHDVKEETFKSFTYAGQEEALLFIRPEYHTVEIYFYGELVIRVEYAEDNRIWETVSIANVLNASRSAYRPALTVIELYKDIRKINAEKMAGFTETYH
ncbi:hypothetical protein CPT_Mater40 [Bacillus phage Mater]|uniref:Uncharacterized protein n=1 Tax=Bacillus phage Mater TaxID=1540090 RepID=A0A0A0RMK5_9CAUD|nr:hypothetical protein CPT_Mater40 [Bacillus phage Mater]AIW03197.1 hypothetical protein CPT_Mater40 [Bacillus phage Mater]